MTERYAYDRNPKVFLRSFENRAPAVLHENRIVLSNHSKMYKNDEKDWQIEYKLGYSMI